MFKNLLLLALFTVILSSCSDDSTNPTPSSDNLLPGDFGSFWIYDNYTLDTSNQRVSQTPDNKDSVVYIRNEQKLGKNARVHVYYRWADGWPETGTENHFVYEDKKIYIHSDLINFYIGLESLPVEIPIDIDEQWLLAGDPNTNTWAIYTKTLTDTTLTVPNYGEIILKTVTLTVDGSYKQTEKVNVKENNLDAHKFEIKLSITGTAELSGFPINLNLSRNIYLYFANDIGNVKTIVEGMKYDIPGIGKGLYPGYEAILTDYSLIINEIQ